MVIMVVLSYYHIVSSGAGDERGMERSFGVGVSNVCLKSGEFPVRKMFLSGPLA
jgi:hypothetical protein